MRFVDTGLQITPETPVNEKLCPRDVPHQVGVRPWQAHEERKRKDYAARRDSTEAHFCPSFPLA